MLLWRLVLMLLLLRRQGLVVVLLGLLLGMLRLRLLLRWRSLLMRQVLRCRLLWRPCLRLLLRLLMWRVGVLLLTVCCRRLCVPALWPTVWPTLLKSRGPLCGVLRHALVVSRALTLLLLWRGVLRRLLLLMHAVVW